MPTHESWPQEVVHCIVRIPNAWVHHLINLESNSKAFTTLHSLVTTLPPKGQTAAETMMTWTRASCVAYPNAQEVNTGILSAMWTNITPDRPLMQYAHGLHQ
jgi:hypothetical protein